MMSKPDHPRSSDAPARPGHVPFATLGLSAEVLKAIEKLGFEETSPIQSSAIPLILSGHDVVGQSETGSGKTAAFCIPAIERVERGVGECHGGGDAEVLHAGLWLGVSSGNVPDARKGAPGSLTGRGSVP